MQGSSRSRLVGRSTRQASPSSASHASQASVVSQAFATSETERGRRAVGCASSCIVVHQRIMPKAQPGQRARTESGLRTFIFSLSRDLGIPADRAAALEHSLALPAKQKPARRLNSTGTQQRVAPGSRNAFRGAHYQSVLYVVAGHQRVVLGIRRCVYSTSLHCGLFPTSACKQTTRPANKQSSACKAERTEYMSKHARMNWVPCNCLPQAAGQHGQHGLRSRGMQAGVSV